MKITINGILVELRYSIRAMIMYEAAVDKLGGGEVIRSVYLLWAMIYSELERTGRVNAVTYDEFLNYLDEYPARLGDLTEWVGAEMSRQAQIRDERNGSDSGDGSKKK